MHWIHTSFQGRWGQASPRIVDDIFLLLSFFFFLSIYLFRSFFSHYTWFDSAILYCLSKQQQQQVFVPLLLYCVVPFFVHYTQYIQYNVYSFFAFLLPRSFSNFFKKKLIQTHCFLLWDFFVCVRCFVSTAAAAPTAFLFRLQYVCMYVCTYVWKEEREEKYDDDDDGGERRRKKKKLRTALLWWLWLLLFLLLLLLLS